MRTPLPTVLVVTLGSVLVAGCGAPSFTGSSQAVEETSSTVVTSTTGSTDGVACSVAGGTTFSASFLDGPQLTRQEFGETPIGTGMETFFVDGPGAPENHHYQRAEGFSLVSDALVLGYSSGLPDSSFTIDNGEVIGWGGCNPNLVSDGLVAARWEPAGPIDIHGNSVAIQIDGGACETAEGREVLTEVEGVDVMETEDEVTLIAWTRDEPFEGPCAGVGIVLDSVVRLSSPLGDRTLLDGGTIPPTVVEFVASDGPPPPSTVAKTDTSSLGSLDCSPGVVVEERVPDRGQDPGEVARTVAPDVVQIRPGQPVWWWGLDETGTVIAGVALGDADGAVYQVWTCDSP